MNEEAQSRLRAGRLQGHGVVAMQVVPVLHPGATSGRPAGWTDGERLPVQPGLLRAFDQVGGQEMRWPQGAAALGLGGAPVPRPIHAVSGRETKRWAGNRLPPSAQKVMAVAHTGMPALIPYLLPQLGTGDAPVAEHDDGHISGTAGAKACSSSTVGSIRAGLVPDVQATGMAQLRLPSFRWAARPPG